MSEDAGKVHRDPLFLALTRPPMLFGVPYDWGVLEGFLWMIVYINTKDFSLMIPGLLATHLIGYIAASKEPRFIDIFKIWARTVPVCINRFYHGNTVSYDLY